jgi:PAS domain S-box-containing protein
MAINKKIGRQPALLEETDVPLSVPVETGATASVRLGHLALIDATGARKTASLRESEERTYRLAGMSADAIIMLDDRGTVTFCNAAAQSMFRCQAAEITGRGFHRLFILERPPGASKEGFARFSQQGRGPGTSKTMEVTALRKDGTEFPLELSLSPLELQGKWHALGIMKDITQRQSRQAQLPQTRDGETVGLFAGDLAHKLSHINEVIVRYRPLAAKKTAAEGG